MNRQYIMVKSITYALKGRTILEDNAIGASIERTPKTGGEKSCGYSLVVNGSAVKAAEILKKNGIVVIGILNRGIKNDLP